MEVPDDQSTRSDEGSGGNPYQVKTVSTGPPSHLMPTTADKATANKAPLESPVWMSLAVVIPLWMIILTWIHLSLHIELRGSDLYFQWWQRQAASSVIVAVSVGFALIAFFFLVCLSYCTVYLGIRRWQTERRERQRR